MFAEVQRHIQNQTYPESRELAVALHQGIMQQVEGLPCEEIDFGEVALDIGGRAGRFAPVIRALGPQYIVTVEPCAEAVDKGLKAGLISPFAAWCGTLEAWADLDRCPADSAFIFGIKPALANEQRFLQSISRVVRAGGIVVTFCAEPATAFSFWNASARHRWTGLQLLRPAGDPRRQTGGLLHLWRRTSPDM